MKKKKNIEINKQFFIAKRLFKAIPQGKFENNHREKFVNELNIILPSVKEFKLVTVKNWFNADFYPSYMNNHLHIIIDILMRILSEIVKENEEKNEEIIKILNEVSNEYK